jgi:hypothetical protein
MTKSLLILIHADPSVRAKYERPDLEVVAFVAPGIPGVPGGGLSSRYDALAQRCKTSGRGHLVRELVKLYPPKQDLGTYDHVFLASWSAGYAFLRHLSDVDKALVDGLVMLDSGHTGLDPDKSASDAGVQWAVWWAKAAAEGRKAFWFGHTDIDPVSYASTTKFGAEMLRLAGVASGQGLLHVQAFNLESAANAKLEHTRALNDWGPGFAHAAVDAWKAKHEQPAEDHGALFDAVTHWTKVTVDAIANAPAWLAKLVQEDEAVVPLPPAHGYRCSVAELIADSRANGRYHRKGSGYVPKVGDYVCSARQGGNPERGGTGHVELIAEVVSDPYLSMVHKQIRTIGGNENDQWIFAPLDIAKPDVLGFIEQDPVVGARAVAIALEQMKLGVKEIRGAAAHPQIQAYHSMARRGGSSLAGMPGHEQEGVAVLGPKASDEVPWCASGASWCLYMALAGLQTARG